MSIFINQLDIINALEDSHYVVIDTPGKTGRSSLVSLRNYFAGVKKINGQEPDNDGNVNLTPDHISDISSEKKFITAAQKEVISKFKTDGSGSAFLADDGSYKTISLAITDAELIAEIESHDFESDAILEPVAAEKGATSQEHFWESPAGTPHFAKCVSTGKWIKLK